MIIRSLAIAAATFCLAGLASAATPTRIRGTVTAVEGATVHVMPNEGGDDVVTLAPDAKVTLVAPTTLDAIKPGSFIGTAAKTEADGTLTAVEVHVFPESMRGSGEGHRPFDLGPKSSMTNGTVGQEVTGKAGQTLTVTYKGAHVIVFAQKGDDGALTAKTLLVGKDGLVPPM